MCLVMCYGSCDEAHIPIRWQPWKENPGQIRKENEDNQESLWGELAVWKGLDLFHSPSIHSDKKGEMSNTAAFTLLLYWEGRKRKERKATAWEPWAWAKRLSLYDHDIISHFLYLNNIVLSHHHLMSYEYVPLELLLKYFRVFFFSEVFKGKRKT